jgi:hypothetical protein
MTCPSCRSESEMVFSVLSPAFLCQEASCGLELEVEWQDVEALLQPDEELIFA